MNLSRLFTNRLPNQRVVSKHPLSKRFRGLLGAKTVCCCPYDYIPDYFPCFAACHHCSLCVSVSAQHFASPCVYLYRFAYHVAIGKRIYFGNYFSRSTFASTGSRTARIFNSRPTIRTMPPFGVAIHRRLITWPVIVWLTLREGRISRSIILASISSIPFVLVRCDRLRWIIPDRPPQPPIQNSRFVAFFPRGALARLAFFFGGFAQQSGRCAR